MPDLKRLTDDDWGALLNVETVQLGRTLVEVRPYGLEELAVIGAIWRRVAGAKGISAGDMADRIDEVIEAAPEYLPHLMEMATGIHRDDLKRLPASKQMEMAAAIIRVNADSKEGLIKNFMGLVGAVTLMMSGGAASDTPMSPSTSSATATAGPTSENTASAKSDASSAPASGQTKTAGKKR